MESLRTRVMLLLVATSVLAMLRFRSTTHDELLLLQGANKHQMLSAEVGHHMGSDEGYDPEKDCLHVKCKKGGELKRKWGADGEPWHGHTRENIGDTWGTHGALGRGFKGVDNHSPSGRVAPCLGKACKQLHGEKWGADGEPLPGHTRENIGDTWGTH